MRILEITMLVMGMIYFISLLIPKARKSKILFYQSIGFIILFIVHYIIEGVRWQLYPLYIMTIILFLFNLFIYTRRKHLNRYKFISTFLILSLLISAVLAYTLPVFKIEEPAGQYNIGTRSYELKDPARHAIYSDHLSQKRKINYQVWYPASTIEDYQQAPWLQDGEPVASGVARMMGFPEFSLSHTTLVESNSYEGAPINTQIEKYPVVIISHGWTGFRNLHTDIAEMLASHGYIVISIDHTYGAAVTVFDDGEVAYLKPAALPNRESTEDFLDYANTLVNTYAGDIDLVLDEIHTLNNNENSFLYGKFDLDHIGLLGHSTGGGAAVTQSLDDSRIKAVVGLDAWVEPIYEDHLKQGLTIPGLLIRSEEWEEHLNNDHLYTLLNSSNNTSLYQIKGSKHIDFSMAYLYSPLTQRLGMTGTLDGSDSADIQHDFILSFFNKHLQNGERKSSDVLHEYKAVKQINID